MPGKFFGLCVLIPVIIGAVMIGASLLINLDRLNPPDPDPLDMAWAQPGDCLMPSEDSESGWMWGSCEDPRAGERIMAVTAGGHCIDLPGAVSARTLNETYCLGDKNVDPATSVNGIVAGECTTPDGTARQDCGTPGHRTVLAVLENEVAVEQPTNTDFGSRLIGGEAFTVCAEAGAAGTDTVASRSLVQTEGSDLLADSGRSWERSLCLSEVR